MRTLKNLLAAGAASLLSSAAFAADLPMPPPYIPPPVEDFGGWYLRGDIGFSNQKVKRFEMGDNRNARDLLSLNQTGSFDTAGIYQIGIGYQFNNWLRGDITGQYRGNSNFKGTDLITFPAGGGVIGDGVNNYTGTKSEWVVMANGYVDLGTWWSVTPFIGAGVGMARVSIADYTDNGAINIGYAGGVPFFGGPFASYASAPAASKWNFAWAAHAGLAYKVNPAMTIELGYSYMNLGDGTTGAVSTYDGFTRGVPMQFKEITSHDLKFGVRWALDPAPVYAPPMPPLMRKG